MKSNKVIAQLTLFSDKEMKLFGKYLSNPHFNKKEAVVRLHKFVAKNHPAYDKQKFSKLNCFLSVFPELKPELSKLNGKADAFISSKLKNPLYDLKKLINGFIIQQEFETESHENTILLIKGLFKRKMHDKAFELIDKELKKLESNIGEDFYHHFYKFQFQNLKEQNLKEADQALFDGMTKDLDLFCAHTRVRFGFEAKSRKIVRGSSFDILLFDELNKLLSKNKVKNITPTILLYHKISKLYSATSTKQYYYTIKQLFIEKFEFIEQKDKKDILAYLINYCIGESKKDAVQYNNEIFTLYKFGFENKLFFNGNYLSTEHYKNAVTLGSSLKKFEWVENFMETKSKFLPPDIRKNNMLLAKAQMENAKGNCKKVIEILQTVESFDLWNNILARNLMMRAYYELKEWSALEYFLDSFAKYISRSKFIGKDRRLRFRNTFKFTRILIQANVKKLKKEDLKSKLDTFKNINNRNWFLKMIEQLKN